MPEDMVATTPKPGTAPAAAPGPRAYVQEAAGLVLLLALAVGCFVILRPFLAAILWAVILTFSTWPIYRFLVKRLGGREGPAAVVMTLLVALVLLLPLVILGSRLAEGVVGLAEGIRSLLQQGPPPPPRWIADLPFLGPDLTRAWEEMAHDGAGLAESLRPYVGPARDWALAQGAALAGGIFETAVSVLTAFFLYVHGTAVVRMADAVFRRVAGDRSRRLMEIAGSTIKGVVHGVLGTALVQAVLATAGFWVAQVPGAFLLGFLSFFLSLFPGGLLLAWIPAAAWLFAEGQREWGIFIIIWNLLVVGTIDNFLKPYVISRGGSLPILMILFGVMGGIIAFGFIGIFLGPTLLAIGYSLIQEWGKDEDAPVPGGR
ncbi:AI-2E family transporter (plasmid) [Skermanella sp. TT6]|uniref:AI-2E family transporter n=1 Tax=Skermanella cutis TaxID=2775420 RepID=A0ABX7BIK4_9PROT|nr:AI-2E family transporter [Skermanella sp. TT6]QQP92926.1 AI-2E family transporter [Skermanella sp. TT6]